MLSEMGLPHYALATAEVIQAKRTDAEQSQAARFGNHVFFDPRCYECKGIGRSLIAQEIGDGHSVKIRRGSVEIHKRVSKGPRDGRRAFLIVAHRDEPRVAEVEGSA